MAAGNTSTLAVEVVSKGITETATRIRKLGEEAGRSAELVNKLTDSTEELMQVQQKARLQVGLYGNMLHQVAQVMAQVQAVSHATAMSINALTNNFHQLGITTNNVQNSLDRKAKSGGVVNTTLRAMATAASAYISLNFARSLATQSDAWAMMQAKLKLATGSMESAKTVQVELYELAQKTRAPIEDMAKLYTRMAIPMQKLGKSSAETKEMIEGVSLALQLGGSTAAEMSSVMLQFSQSINAGRLNGAEFNAVAEGAPSILRAIEAELRSTGEWGENTTETLKKMGAEGKISVELMQRALANALPQWRKDFEELPKTVDASMTLIVNAWKKMVGESNTLRGYIAELARTFGNVSEIIEELTRVQKDLESQFGTTGKEANGFTTAAKGIGIALESVLVLGANVSFVFKSIGRDIGATFARIERYASGDIKGGNAILAWSKEDAAQARKELDEYEKKIVGMTDRAERRKIQATDAVASAAGLDTRAEDKRLNSGKPKDEFAGAMSLNDIRDKAKSFAKIREDVEKEHQEKLTDIRKAYGKAMRDAKTDEERLKLKQEMNAREVAIAKDLKSDLESLEKKGAPKGANKVSDYSRLMADAMGTKEKLEKAQDDGVKKLTSSESLLEEMTSKRKTTYKDLNDVQFKTLQGIVAQNAAVERQRLNDEEATKATQVAANERDKWLTGMGKGTEKINEQVLKVKEQTLALQGSKAATKDLVATQLEAEASLLEAEALRQLDKNGDTLAYERLMAQAAATRELATANRELGAAADSKKAQESMDKLLDPAKAMDFGNTLAGAFGKAGGAIGGMTKALDQYGDRMKAIAKAREGVMIEPDQIKRTQMLADLEKKEGKAKLRQYGDIAGAAKGFFKEHTAGYKVLGAAEKAFRVMELADTIKNNTAKVDGVWAFVSAKGAEIGAMLTGASVDTATTGTQLANSATKTAANIAEGASKMFSQLGWFGFAAVGAMLAVMAGLGAGGSGGTKQMGFEERQKKQGTGGVLGDEDAKSKSISNALEQLESTADIGLRYSSGMLTALQSINAGISNMAKFVAQGTGMRGTAADEARYGVGSSKSALGWSKSSTEMTDAGIQFAAGQTVGSMANRVMAQSYADITKKKSSAWGLSKSTKRYTETEALEEGLLEQISMTVADFQNGIGAAADALGKNGTEIKKQLESFGFNIERISLKGLSGEDIAAELEAVFGKLGDDMAHAALAGFDDFQKVGEGYFETVVRVANGLEVGTNALERIGVEAVSYNEIMNKQGDVATELVRDSIKVREAGTNIGEMMNGMSGAASDLVENYTALLDIQDNLKAFGLGQQVTREMIAGAGGLDALTSAMSDYLGMLPESEQAVVKAKSLAEQFKRLGIEMPKTNAAMAEMIKGYMAGDAASQKLGATVMSLVGEFTDLQSMYEEIVDTARDDLADAYEAEVDALEETRKKFEEFGASLRKFRDSLLTGDMSTLTLGQKYEELTSRYLNTLSLARSGDKDAIGKFESVASEFLKVSREYNASGASYTADFESVLNDSAYLAAVADSQVDVAQASLNALEKQVSGLIEVNESVKTVAEAISALHKSMANAGMALPVDGSHANGLSFVPFDGYTAELHKGEAVLTAAENKAMMAGKLGNSNEPLINEIRALRQEVATLRSDQANQTGQLIASNYDAQERAAEKIVDGTQDAVSKSSWETKSKIGIN